MRIEKLISVLFHPVFIPTMTVFLVIKQYSNIIILENQAMIIFIGTLIFSMFLPLVNVFFLLFLKKINSLEMQKKEERYLPLLFAIASMLVGYYVLKDIFNYAPIMKSIYLGAIYTLIPALLITKKWKISLHMLAIGGACGVFFSLEILFGNSLYTLFSFIFTSGVLGYSRFTLKAHNLNQIYTGYILGNVVMCLSIFYL